MTETQQAIEDVKKAVADFQAANNEALKQKADTGRIDALLDEKVNRLNAQIDAAEARLKARVDSIERRVETDGLHSTGRKTADLAAEAAAFGQLLTRERSMGLVPMPVDQLVAYKAALVKNVRYGIEGLTPEERAALQVGVDTDGGQWVTPDMSGRVVQRVYETSPIRQIAAQQTISSDALEGVNDLDEASSGWVGETTSPTETDTPEVGKWRIPVHEQYAEPRATQRILDDAAIDVEAWLAGKVADKLSRVENTAFVSGDGNLKPRGFAAYTTAATADGSRAWGQLEHVVTGVNGGFHATTPGDNLIDVVFKLKSALRQNAVWVMARSTVAATRKLKDGDGNYLWARDFERRQGGMLLDYPIVEAEDMPVIATNSLSIAFGNFRVGYQIVDRAGIRVLRDPYTAKPYVKFYTTRRVGGGVIEFDAIKFLKFST